MNLDRFQPPSAHDEITSCVWCGQRFHYTMLEEGYCPECRPEEDEEEEYALAAPEWLWWLVGIAIIEDESPTQP